MVSQVRSGKSSNNVLCNEKMKNFWMKKMQK